MTEEPVYEEPTYTEAEITSDDKLWAALGYAFGIVALIVLFVDDKKERPFIKFHAVQSLALNVAFAVIAIVLSITVVGALCLPIVWLVFLYWAYKAYQGEYFDVPVVTDFIKGQGWV